MDERPQTPTVSPQASPSDEALAAFRSTALFSRCSGDDLGIIASLSGTVEWNDGDRIFAVGDPSERLYIVREGEVVIRKDDNEGRSVEIARFLPGDCFGELDLFTGKDRSADAFASEKVSLLTFPGGDGGLDALAESHPGVNARLLHAFLVQVSERIRGVNALVKENSPLVRELRRQVYVDKLTGLFNRTFFEEKLSGMLSGTAEPVGLLMYKPDNFKDINDTHGHEAGDKVLRSVADGLKSFVPDRDMLFRYMGNENAILFPGADRNLLRGTAERTGAFLRSLDFSTLLDGNGIRLSVSFGLALSPEHGTDAASLVETTHALTLEGRRRGGNFILFPEDSEDT